MYGKLFLFLIFILISNSSSSDDNLRLIEENITAEELLKIRPNDRAIGDKNAPITVIEYASFSCYHCALFHMDALPIIERDYIKTGKVLFIFRNFPLDYKSLKASMLGYCYDKINDYFTFNKAVFSSIESWNYKPNDLSLLENIARISNISQEKFNKCINNQNILDTIINEKFLATKKLKITATPIFFINGKKHEGFHSIGYFTSLFDSLIESKP